MTPHIEALTEFQHKLERDNVHPEDVKEALLYIIATLVHLATPTHVEGVPTAAEIAREAGLLAAEHRSYGKRATK